MLTYGDVNAVATTSVSDHKLWREAEAKARALGFSEADSSAARAIFYWLAWNRRAPVAGPRDEEAGS
jgi:hypothetical protein